MNIKQLRKLIDTPDFSLVKHTQNCKYYKIYNSDFFVELMRSPLCSNPIISVGKFDGYWFNRENVFDGGKVGLDLLLKLEKYTFEKSSKFSKIIFTMKCYTDYDFTFDNASKLKLNSSNDKYPELYSTHVGFTSIEVAKEYLDSLLSNFRVKENHTFLIKDFYEMIEHFKSFLFSETRGSQVEKLFGNYIGTKLVLTIK